MKMCFIHYVKLFCIIYRMIYDSNTLGFEFIKFQQRKIEKIASRRQSKGEQNIKSGGGSIQQRQLEQRDWESKQK